MRIASVTLKSFRVFRDGHPIRLDSFTAIVGRNDSGKSSILHALDIFFNRSPDLYDFTIGTSPQDPIEITVRFEDLPPTIEIEDGVTTTFADEHLVDDKGCLAVKKVYSRWTGSRPSPPAIRLLAVDFSKEDLQNLCSKNERTLNQLGQALRLDFSRAGRGITNKDKRQALREQGRSKGIPTGEVEYEISKDVWQALSSCLPSFSLFVADWRLSEEETGFQNEFKGIIEEATQGMAERTKIEGFIESHIDQEVAKIHGFLKRHTDEISSLKVRPQFKWKDLVSFQIEASDREGLPVLLRKRGAGLRRLLMVAYFQYLAAKGAEVEKRSKHIFGIEEPETYLHPGAQRELLQSLKVVAQAGQVVITTHSPVFAGAAPRESLVWTKKLGGVATTVEGSDLDLEELARDLGVEPSDQVYGYRACIFVEGQDDVLFLETVVSKLREANQVPTTFLERQIGIVPIGGLGNLKHWVNRKALRALSRRYGVFVDSDRRSINEAMKSDRRRWKAECEADGGMFHETRKREIENYLHPEVVRQRTQKAVLIDDFCDVKAVIGDGCIGFVKHMTAAQLLECDQWVDENGQEHHELVEVVQSFLALA